MIRTALLIYSLCFTSICLGENDDFNINLNTQAERYFRGVYECNPSIVDTLAAEDIVVSYPVFKQIYGNSTIRGREAVKSFSEHFCSRWLDTNLTINESIEERDKVVLVWTFSARDAQSEERLHRYQVDSSSVV